MACGNLIDKSRAYSLCDKCMSEINWITKNTCDICGKDLGPFGDESNICFECMEIEHSFTRGFSCTTYEGPVKEILSGLKYRNRPYFAGNMGEIMKDRAEEFIHDIKIDIVIPVPMFKKKEKDRGYNQASLLASSIGKSLQILYRDDILLKMRATSPMSSLDSGERRINLHNAFGIGYNKEADVFGKNILLVDDVYTTGSTADECSDVLNHNGASKVYFFSFTSGVNMKRLPN